MYADGRMPGFASETAVAVGVESRTSAPYRIARDETLQAVGLPIEMQGIIIAVDRVLDMCRTSVNVWSDSCGCAVIARLEATGSGEKPEPEVEFTDQP